MMEDLPMDEEQTDNNNNNNNNSKKEKEEKQEEYNYNNNNMSDSGKENIGSKIDNPYFLRFLLYFLISIIVVGVLVGLVFVLQQNNANNTQNTVLIKLNQTILKVNQTLAAVNFTQQQLHEDNARDNQTDKQNKFEMMGRSNQTRTLINETKEAINSHHVELMKFIKQQNATFARILKEIFESQDQNDEILKVQKNVSLANRELLKAGIDKIGLNSTEILEDYNNTSKNSINIGNATKNK